MYSNYIHGELVSRLFYLMEEGGKTICHTFDKLVMPFTSFGWICVRLWGPTDRLKEENWQVRVDPTEVKLASFDDS